jgi:N-acetylmuramoyl-L-alanine amidase
VRHLILLIASSGALASSIACSGGASPSTPTAPIIDAALPAGVQVDATAITQPTPDGPRRKIVVLDPGHGGPEVGAANYDVVEKHSNLDMALRIERYLAQAGVRVILTRRDDGRLAEPPAGVATGFGATRRDLQARVDLANAEGADVFLSIHSNGSTDPSQRGVEVWYDPNREFGDQNRQLAQALLTNVLAELDAYGYAAVDRGLKDDTCFRMRFDRCFPLFVLGQPRTTTRDEVIRRGGTPDALGFAPGQEAITTRATEMPGALLELLFISNAADAAVLADDRGRDAIARGVAEALVGVLGLEVPA